MQFSAVSAAHLNNITPFPCQLVALPSPNLTCGALYWVMSPIYCNAVLGNLNSRDFVRDRGQLQDSLVLPTDLVLSLVPSTGHTAHQSRGLGSLNFQLGTMTDKEATLGDDHSVYR